MAVRFAQRMSGVRKSTIREILKAAVQPDMISLAGGLPAPELFPVADVATAVERVLSEVGPSALQYGESEGYRPLRELLACRMAKRGISCSFNEVLITNGSQQALDLIGKVMLDPGDVVLTENPTYLAALQAFQCYEVRFIPVPTDGSGIIPDELTRLIDCHRPKFLYTIPNFQNPTGVTLAPQRREAIYKIAAARSLLIVEDDPYGELRYRGTHIVPIKAHDSSAQVVYASTFSKTIAPGLRLGWVVAGKEILEKMIVAKQATDLHTTSLGQMTAYRYLSDFDNEAHIEKIRTAYGERCSAMATALACDMPDGTTWTDPDGGMFLWVSCPGAVDTTAMLSEASAAGVLYVPGADFFPCGGGHNHMRLNFSCCAPEGIRLGVSRLANVCRMRL